MSLGESFRAHCRRDSEWLTQTVEAVRTVGYCIVEGVLDESEAEEVGRAMYGVQKQIQADIGLDRLDRAGERGVLRLMMAYDPTFIRLIELPEVLAVVDNTVSETAIMHLQNGFILPPAPPDRREDVFQTRFHPDFPRLMNGYMASINTLLTISPFTADNGGTLVVPGSQQKDPRPDTAFSEANAVAVDCPAGSMIVFDSTLIHAAGQNRSSKDRLGINHQFTRSFFKQQIDYCRALGEERILKLAPRTRQILGYYTRIPTCLDDYYQPAERRLYQPGQG